jgi:hypothetical protein
MLNNFEIVFVHLGEAKANHLWKNINRIKQNWPDSAITLISDSKHNLRKAQEIGILSYDFQLNESFRKLFDHSKHNSSFRQGFWNYSILRLFAVLDYSISKPDARIVHLESDIAIFPNFPFDKLSNLDKPSWMRFSESHDVGAIFILPNAVLSQFLLDQFVQLFSDDPGLTDMTLLNTFARAHPDLVLYLPVAVNRFDELIRHDIAESSESANISCNFSHFDGIFDSAPLGMWLLGEDPRNHLGRIIRYRELPESYIQPHQVRLNFDEANGLLYFNNQVPIFNLHVHSKEVKYFDKRWRKAIQFRVRNSHKLSRKSSFSIRAFGKLCTDFLKRNGVSAIPRGFSKLFKSLN